MDWLLLMASVGVGFLQILQLVTMEGALSGDNITVVAGVAEGLPEEAIPPKPFNHHFFGDQQRAVLQGGIIGAYVMRGGLLFLAHLLMSFSIETLFPHAFIQNGLLLFLYHLPLFKAAGGLWLVKIYVWHQLGWEHDPEKASGVGNFWRALIRVEILDLLFSADNIISAAGVSRNIWIVILGVLIGVTLLRYASFIMLDVLKRFPRLKNNVYWLILAIGGELLIDAGADSAPRIFGIIGLHSGVPDWLKILVAFVIIGGTILWSIYEARKEEGSEVERIINFDPTGPVIEGFIVPSHGQTPGNYMVQFVSAATTELVRYNVNTAIIVSACRSRGHDFFHFFGRPSTVEKEIRAIGPTVAAQDDDRKVRVILSCTGPQGKDCRDLGEFTSEELQHIEIKPDKLDLQFGGGRYMMPAINYAHNLLEDQEGVNFLHYVNFFYRSTWDLSEVLDWRQSVAYNLSKSAPSEVNPAEKLVVLWKGMEGEEKQPDLIDSSNAGSEIDPADVIKYNSIRQLVALGNNIFKELFFVNSKGVVYKHGKITSNGDVLVDGRITSIVRGQIPIGSDHLKIQIPGYKEVEWKW